MDWLRTQGYRVEKSTKEQDMHFDIDAFVVHPKDEKRFIPISIKANEPKYATAPFVFELSIGYIGDQVSEGYEGETTTIGKNTYAVRNVKTWYERSQAHLYLIWKRDTDTSGIVWMLDKRALKEYTDKHGFEKVTRNSNLTPARMLQEGKAYTEVGLMSQETLHKLGIAKRIGRIDYIYE
jgi:hypothetical protein